MQHASGRKTIWHNTSCVCTLECCMCGGFCRLCMHMHLCNFCVCIKVYTLSLLSAVRVPGSIQHLDQQVSPSCTSTLTQSTDLHSPAEREATQLLIFPRLYIQSYTVQSYCNWAPAMFHHVLQSTASVLECSVVLYPPCFALRLMLYNVQWQHRLYSWGFDFSI